MSSSIRSSSGSDPKLGLSPQKGDAKVRVVAIHPDLVDKDFWLSDAEPIKGRRFAQSLSSLNVNEVWKIRSRLVKPKDEKLTKIFDELVGSLQKKRNDKFEPTLQLMSPNQRNFFLRYKDKNGDTVWHLAARYCPQKLEALLRLVEKPKDGSIPIFDLENLDSVTPLEILLASKNDNETHLLVSAGAANHKLQAMLEIAVSHGAVNTARILRLRMFAKAIRENDHATFDRLLKLKEININTHFESRSFLSLALENPDPTFMHKLLKAGAIVDLETLRCAYSIPGKRSWVLQLVEEYFPQIESRDRGRQTPLMVAAANNDAKSVALLLKKGESLSAMDTMLNGAIHLAAREGAMDALQILLDQQGSQDFIDFTNTYSKTPIEGALRAGKNRTALLLAQSGAIGSYIDRTFELAVSQQCFDVAAHLAGGFDKALARQVLPNALQTCNQNIIAILVEKITKKPIDIDIDKTIYAYKDCIGRPTTLILAALQNNNREAALQLAKAGAKGNRISDTFELACTQKYFDVALALAKHLELENIRRLLVQAIKADNLALAEILIANLRGSANIPIDGQPFIMLALKRGQSDIAEQLIKAGATLSSDVFRQMIDSKQEALAKRLAVPALLAGKMHLGDLLNDSKHPRPLRVALEALRLQELEAPLQHADDEDTRHAILVSALATRRYGGTMIDQWLHLGNYPAVWIMLDTIRKIAPQHGNALITQPLPPKQIHDFVAAGPHDRVIQLIDPVVRSAKPALRENLWRGLAGEALGLRQPVPIVEKSFTCAICMDPQSKSNVGFYCAGDAVDAKAPSESHKEFFCCKSCTAKTLRTSGRAEFEPKICSCSGCISLTEAEAVLGPRDTKTLEAFSRRTLRAAFKKTRELIACPKASCCGGMVTTQANCVLCQTVARTPKVEHAIMIIKGYEAPDPSDPLLGAWRHAPCGALTYRTKGCDTMTCICQTCLPKNGGMGVRWQWNHGDDPAEIAQHSKSPGAKTFDTSKHEDLESMLNAWDFLRKEEDPEKWQPKYEAWRTKRGYQ
jgi:ankyrin repeat protein